MSYLTAKSNLKNIRKKKRRIILIKNVLLLSFFVISIYFFCQSSFFSLNEIEIEGLKRLSYEDVVKASGLSKGANLFEINLSQVRKRILAHPLVKRVEIKRQFPRTVLIKIKERTPCALVLYKSTFLVVDRNAFCIDNIHSPNFFYSLPVITGLNLKSAELGRKIVTNHSLEMVLAALNYKVQNDFSEFNLARPQQIIAYTRSGLPVLLGPPENISQKLQLAVVLAKNIKEPQYVEYIDLRAVQAPAIKYKDKNFMKEEILFIAD